MDQVQKKTEALLLSVKESDEYVRYQKASEEIRKYPALKEKADEFRRQNYEFQSNETEHFEEGDRLRAEYACMLEQPVVWEYLLAETAVCRMLRRITWRLLEDLDIESGF